MKKQSIILTILVLLTSKAISQTASDSITCLPNYQLKKAINIIEKAKVTEHELELTKNKVLHLDSLFSIKNSIIGEYVKKDQRNDSLINAYKSVAANYKKIVANSEMSYAFQTLKLNKERLKKWGTLAIGISIGFLVFN